MATMTTMAAVPTMTSMYYGGGAYATPVAYNTPVTMTATPVAAGIPMTTVAAPMAPIPMTTVAAPMAPMLPEPAPTSTPSSVPQPCIPGESFIAPNFGMPVPKPLTQGLTAPERLADERSAYEKALQEQLQKQSEAVMEESKIKQQMLQQEAQTKIQQFQLQTDEQTRLACMQIERETLNTLNGLHEAAAIQQTAFDERSAMAAFEYKRKKAQEEMSQKAYALQKEWFDGEARMMHEYKKVMRGGC